MATRTRVSAKVMARAEAAAKLSRRLLGDLRAINRVYGLWKKAWMENICADIQQGVERGCIERIDVNLFDRTDKHIGSYSYLVTEGGRLSASPHSGRIKQNPKLVGGRGRLMITISDDEVWEQLELRLPWPSGKGPDLEALGGVDDGAYVAGSLALARKKYGDL